MFVENFRRHMAKTMWDDYISGRLSGAEWPEVDVSAVFDAGIEVPEPDVLYRVDGKALLYSGLANSLFGDAGAGKTAFCQSAVADEIKHGRHTYVVDYEVNVRVWLARLLALGVAPEEIKEYFHYLDNSSDGGPPKTMRAGSSLMVLDSLTAALDAFGCEANDPAGIESIYRQVIDPFTDAGLAALVIDHVGHADKSRPMNSIRKTGKVQGAMLRMEGVPGRPFGRDRTGEALLKVHKDNMGGLGVPKGQTVAKFTMASTEAGKHIRCCITTGGELDLAALSAATPLGPSDDVKFAFVLNVVRDPTYAPMSTNALAEAAKELADKHERPISKSTFERAIKAMLVVDDPVIKKAGVRIVRAR